MSNNIIAFAGSNSRKSINKQLASYAGSLLKHHSVTVLDLNDFEAPIYSIDREMDSGIPKEILFFQKAIEEADGIIISFAEHNGNFSVAFKNVFDWLSRSNRGVWANKPMLLMATSPGKSGGASVLSTAKTMFGYMQANTVASFSLPSFQQHFVEGKGITDGELLEELTSQVGIFEKAIPAALKV